MQEEKRLACCLALTRLRGSLCADGARLQALVEDWSGSSLRRSVLVRRGTAACQSPLGGGSASGWPWLQQLIVWLEEEWCLALVAWSLASQLALTGAGAWREREPWHGAEGGVGAGRRRLEVGGGDHKEMKQGATISAAKHLTVLKQRRAQVFVELRGEARAKAVYLLY